MDLTFALCELCGLMIEPSYLHLCNKQSSIEDTLKERGSRYGTLRQNGNTAQELKETFRFSKNWTFLTSDKQEALDQIASKIARVLSGDPDYPDNWHDIAGYATCVEKAL